MVLGKVSAVPGHPTYLDNSRQGPIARAVVASGGRLDSFSRLPFLFSFSLFGRRPGITEILSQRAVIPKTTNQPNLVVSSMITQVYSYYHISLKFRTKMRVEV